MNPAKFPAANARIRNKSSRNIGCFNTLFNEEEGYQKNYAATEHAQYEGGCPTHRRMGAGINAIDSAYQDHGQASGKGDVT